MDTKRRGQDSKKREKKRNGCIDLLLYVVNRTPRCMAAYNNLLRICEVYAERPYRITVIDIAVNPEMAREAQITAIPTLVRLPRKAGTRKIIGTLDDTRRVVEELGLAERMEWKKPAPAGI